MKNYGDAALSIKTCECRLDNSNNYFDVNDKERSEQPKMLENADLQALLDKNSIQSISELAKALNSNHKIVTKHLHHIKKILYKRRKRAFTTKSGNTIANSLNIYIDR